MGKIGMHSKGLTDFNCTRKKCHPYLDPLAYKAKGRSMLLNVRWNVSALILEFKGNGLKFFQKDTPPMKYRDVHFLILWQVQLFLNWRGKSYPFPTMGSLLWSFLSICHPWGRDFLSRATRCTKGGGALCWHQGNHKVNLGLWPRLTQTLITTNALKTLIISINASLRFVSHKSTFVWVLESWNILAYPSGYHLVLLAFLLWSRTYNSWPGPRNMIFGIKC